MTPVAYLLHLASQSLFKDFPMRKCSGCAADQALRRVVVGSLLLPAILLQGCVVRNYNTFTPNIEIRLPANGETTQDQPTVDDIVTEAAASQGHGFVGPTPMDAQIYTPDENRVVLLARIDSNNPKNILEVVACRVGSSSTNNYDLATGYLHNAEGPGYSKFNYPADGAGVADYALVTVGARDSSGKNIDQVVSDHISHKITHYNPQGWNGNPTRVRPRHTLMKAGECTICRCP